MLIELRCVGAHEYTDYSSYDFKFKVNIDIVGRDANFPDTSFTLTTYGAHGAFTVGGTYLATIDKAAPCM